MNDEVVINLFKKVARILEDDKQYEWLADEVKDYLNEIYVNKAFEPEQEAVEDRIARWHRLGYEQGKKASKRERINHNDILDRSIDGSFEYRDGFMDGVMFAENHHGIGEER